MIEKVKAGTPEEENPLVRSAGAVNQVIDSSNYYHSRIALGQAVIPETSPETPFKVKVKNISDGDLIRGKVLQLGDPLLTDLSNVFLWFEADTPANPTPAAKCCILLKPIPVDGFGDALIAGCCIASINVSDDTHTHASPVNGSNDLASGTRGQFEILTPLSGTGVQEAAVRIGSPQGYVYIQGSLVGAMGDGETHWTCDNIAVFQGADPRDDPTDPDEAIEFENIRHWAGDDDALIDLIWDGTRWVPVQLNCPEPA